MRNFPELQATQKTCSQTRFLGANGTFSGELLWLCLIHIVVEIFPETCVKELFLSEFARADCDKQSTPACSRTIHIESFTSSNLFFICSFDSECSRFFVDIFSAAVMIDLWENNELTSLTLVTWTVVSFQQSRFRFFDAL